MKSVMVIPAAEMFLLRGICEWGQSQEERIKVTTDYIRAAGFEATATCGPVFGGIIPREFEGPDGLAATEWLRGVIGKRGWRGEANSEMRYLSGAVVARQQNQHEGKQE